MSAREVDELHQTLMRRLGDSSVPTLPEVAVKVIHLVSNPNSTLKHFVDVVQNDQALTGRLLRSANSAAFAQRQPVTQLQRAMVLLGLDRLKAMALGFHLSKAASSDESGFSFKRLWTYSIFRAWTAFRLTEYFDRTITGESFIVGLMLDAGIPMMPKLIGESYQKVVNTEDIPQKQYLCEVNGLEFTHVDVIAALGKMWKLPPMLLKPMMAHHTSPDAMNPKDHGSILQAVAYFVGTMSLEHMDGRTTTPASVAVARRLFSMDEAELKKVLKNAASDFRASKEMFTHVLDDTVSIEKILAQANMELTDSSAVVAVSSGQAGTAPRFESGGLVFEVERSTASRVRVVVADQQGHRLLSEEIEPEKRTPEEIRKALMLEDASSEMFEKVLSEMRRLAA